MYESIVAKYANFYNVPEWWINTFIQTESSFNQYAYRWEPKRNEASFGLMQLLESTARGLGYVGLSDGLYDPDTNIGLGTKLIAQLRARFGDDIKAVYSAYNSGSATAYLNNDSVAQHVANMLRNSAMFVESVIADNPVESGIGGAGIIVAALIIWYFMKRKR